MARAELQAAVAASYVRDIGMSRAFYELLGFSEQRSGKAPTSAWSALGSDGYLLLLVSTRLREAAASVAAQDREAVRCEAPGPGRAPCGETADVKLADSGGDAAWVCLTHAEEILIAVPAAFIASLDDRVITAFLERGSVPGTGGGRL